MSIKRIAETLAGSLGDDYFVSCSGSSLTVGFGDSAPRTSKTACGGRWRRPHSIGVAWIEPCLQRVGLPSALGRHIRFAQRNNRYSISESLKALILPTVLGLGGIATTEPLRYNGVLHYLAGLPGYPEATRWRRFLQRFARAGRNAWVKLHDRWRGERIGPPARPLFDLDSTVWTV